MSQEGMNGADSGFGNWKPFSSTKSGKSWADMVESVSDWSSSEDSSYMSKETRATSKRLLVDKWYEKNEAVYSSDTISYNQLSSAKDMEDYLLWKYKAVDINEEFRKPTARRSLYFDQKQEYEHSAEQDLHSNTHDCAGSNQSTCSDSGSDSSGVDFPYGMDHFGEILEHEPSEQQYLYSNWRKNSTPLRKEKRLQALKEITSQEDSAEKDMDIVMKQLKNRADEAIEAVKSFRSLFSQKAQESLDNVLIDLYKKAGRIGEHIELLQRKLALLEGSGNKSCCCSAEHEKSRLLGNLGWAYMQQKNYKVAVELYGKALSVEADNKSKECRLAICFKQIERIRIAKSLLQSLVDGGRGLVHSSFRVSSHTNKVQQSGIRKCFGKGQHQNSGKSWADMVEQEEDDEECSSLFSASSAENMVESVSEWGSNDSSYMSQEDVKCNDKNEAVYGSDENLSDTKDNLEWKYEAVDIDAEFRKPAAPRSLYFDQKQEYEHSAQQYLFSNTHDFAGSNRSTCSDYDSDSSGVEFSYDVDNFRETLNIKHELGDVKNGIKSVYVHDKHNKGGTVVIVFRDGSKLYVLADGRLSYEFIIDPDTGKKEYRICYLNKQVWEGVRVCEGLRLKLEEVGEKITACGGFISALAGNYKIAHHVCENLKQMWINEEIGSDHRFLVERLEEHSTHTDFVLVTPNNAGGFEISSVTDQGIEPMVGRFLCLGSGREIAETLIRDRILDFNGKTDSEIVEMLKDIAYDVCLQESTVGGVITVASCEVVEKSSEDQRLRTEFFKFPPLKKLWPITILDDGIYFAKDESFLLIDKNVLDFGILENIEEGDLTGYHFRPDLVTIRIFLDATGTFYHSSDYFERTDFMDFEDVVLSYNKDKHKFKMVLESTNKDTQELYKSMVVGKTKMFWDNQNKVFVLSVD